MTEYRSGNPLAFIIEDDKTLATIIAMALKKANFATETVADGHMAIAQLAEMTPAIVVLDLHLPSVNGQDILQHIRAQPHLANTRVIIATGNPQMAKSLRRDADLILEKPVDYRQFQILASRLHPGNVL